MNVCQRNVARFGHMECRFDKINYIFQGFGSLVSLQLQKDGGAKKTLSKQISKTNIHEKTFTLQGSKCCLSTCRFQVISESDR